MFGLKPAQIIQQLDLLRPIYEDTSAYGHFGRTDGDFPWERLDKAAVLADECGVVVPAETGS